MFESLHNHTTLSDGTQTHLEALATAEQASFGVIAFTDHDALPNNEILSQLNNYKGPVQWHIGCEISSGLPVELGGGPASMFHILGLFVDPDNKELQEHCSKALVARKKRMQAIVQNLRDIGLTISEEDCEDAAGGESIGRPHIVQAIHSHPENAEVIDVIREDMRRAAQGNPEIAEAYQRMLQDPAEKHPYRLFLSNDSFISNVYVDYTYWTSMEESVRLIRQAGGKAILAHWPTVKTKIPLEKVSEYITQGKLDGIEVASGFLGAGYEDDERAMRELATQLGCISTIGIDAHRAEDYQLFVQNKSDDAEQSIGQTARILEGIKRK